MLCIDPACTVSCEFVGACRYVTVGGVACASRLTTADFMDTLARLPGVSGQTWRRHSAGVSCVSRFHGHVSEAAGRFGADLTETFGGRLAGVSCVSRFHGHVSEAAGRFGADLMETFGGRLAGAWRLSAFLYWLAQWLPTRVLPFGGRRADCSLPNENLDFPHLTDLHRRHFVPAFSDNHVQTAWLKSG